MIDTEALRKKVIDLAIQGKLTQQLPEDGNAEDLYVQIQEEKAKLVKEGKIKKDKTLTEISNDEIPFEIPNNWRWVRIGDATYNHGQKTPDKRFCYIDVGTLDNVNHKLNDNENIIEAKDAPSRAKKIVKYDDVLYSTVRPYLHNICIVDKDFSCEPIASTAFAVMHTFDNCLLSRFLYYWLLSEWFDKYANGDSSKGTLYPAIGEKDFFMGLVPLAPFEEQKRIVDVIDTVFVQLNVIDDLQQQYESDCEILKGKIINAGIRGMLTDQLPEDGNAEDLYEQIQNDKALLIKEGKIKKEKNLPEISDDEIPFEIPNNWKWVRLGNYSQKITDQVASGSFASLRDNVPSLKEPSYAIMVKTADFANGFSNNLTYTDKNGYEFLSNSNLFGGELILSNIGSIGKCFIVPKLDKKMTLAPNSIMIRLTNEELRDYLYYFILSKQGYLELDGISTGTAVKKFNKTDLKKILIPVPPLAEQTRIASRIEEIFTLLGI